MLSDGPSGRLGTTLLAMGATPVGLAFYRISTTSGQLVDPAVSGTPDRETRQAFVRTLVTSHLGVTVQQSVGDYVTLGATLKLVRGRVGRATLAGGSWEDLFDGAEALDRRGSTRGDVDLGAMLATGRVRAGVVVRNATAPTFGEGDESGGGGAVSLKRHARVGAAWADSWPGISRLIVSLDADLTRVPHPAGERRDVAAGIERWLRGQQVGVRAGVRASTVGDARPVVSAGGSFAVRAGAFVDAYVARGTRHDRGWGLAVRLSY
ncbi:MAG TPA: conjugal transfer protein TraF [Vicinamibacterales bacterium]|nr:conjugal transfer protein TraF [Vicinamibacterales bacterium]